MRKRALILFLWWLASTASAFAEDVSLTFTPQEIAAIVKSMDRQPLSRRAPDGYWSAQAKIRQAVIANPSIERDVERQLVAR